MAGSTEAAQFHDDTPTPDAPEEPMQGGSMVHHDHDDGLVHSHAWAVSAPDR